MGCNSNFSLATHGLGPMAVINTLRQIQRDCPLIDTDNIGHTDLWEPDFDEASATGSEESTADASEGGDGSGSQSGAPSGEEEEED